MATPAPVAARADSSARGEKTVLPGQAPDGSPILSVLVKRTFDIATGSFCTPAGKDLPLVPGDVCWDDPASSTIRYESDFIPYKLATDVVLNGVVHAPGGAPAYTCLATLQVNMTRKAVAVFGDRVAGYAGGGPPWVSDPVPFTTMELRYERAYGGTDVYSDPKVPYAYARNPLGRGFVVHKSPKSLENLALPNLEEPQALLDPTTLCLEDFRRWESWPMPAGFGWFRKTWMPRALLAGIMPGDRAVEQQLRQAYAQLLPADQRGPYLQHGIRDMDFRFFNGASPGLVMPYLAGGEWVGVENLTPEGRTYFRLPEGAPRIGLDIGTGVQEPEVVLQTVMIRMEEGQLDLVWRGAVPYPGPDWLPEMRMMDVFVD